MPNDCFIIYFHGGAHIFEEMCMTEQVLNTKKILIFKSRLPFFQHITGNFRKYYIYMLAR